MFGTEDINILWRIAMLQEERLLKLIEYLRDNGSGSFKELSELLGISEVTVRKDLAELEHRKAVKLVRGGAVWEKSDLTRAFSQTRDIINREEKQQLVKCLGELVENGYAVSLNGGTTTVEAARFLAENYNSLTVITNNLNVVDVLREKEEFQVILTGGIYYEKENTVTGRQSERDMALYNVDLSIIAVNGISLEKGITDFRIEESGIINAMIKSARKSAVIADHSKFERISCINVCPLERIDYVITDSGISGDTIAEYKRNGIDIIRKED